MAEHQEFGVLGHLAPGQRRQAAQQTTDEQVDDRNDHSAMIPADQAAQAGSSNRTPQDPSAGATVLAAPDLVRMLDGVPGVQQELMRFQVEIATRVCTSLDGLGRELARLRRLVADAAAQLGCCLVASGTAPLRTPGLTGLTGQPGTLSWAAGMVRCWPILALAAATRTSEFPPGPGRSGADAAAALACSAARRHRELTDRRRP